MRRAHFLGTLPILVTGMILSPSLRAQEAPGSDSVLARLTAEAIIADPSLAARRAMTRAAEARIRPAGALPDPMLTAGVMDLTLPEFAFRESEFTEVDVELSQEIPWPGTLGARTGVARAGEAGAQAGVGAARREVTVAMAAAYYRLRYAAAALEAIARQERLLETAVQLSTTRYATGSVPQTDPLQAKLARDRLRTEQAVLRGEYAAALALVNALRDRPSAEPVAVAPLAIVGPGSLSAALPPVDSLSARAVAAHPRIAARRAAVEQASQAIAVERLGARPDLTFTVRYGYRPTLTSGINSPDFFSAFLGLRVPLWAGRKQHRLADAARADSATAAAELRATELALAREVAEVAARAQAARERLALLVDGVVPAARATVESAARNYQVGRAEFLTLILVEDALFRAEVEAAAVAAELYTHLVMLRELTAEEPQS